MKSICIKINNKKIQNYLLNKFENIDLAEFYISVLKFKHYENIIIHYTGNNTELFINSLSNIIVKTIIYFFEKKLIYRFISLNYFYFNIQERKQIVRNAIEFLDNENARYDLINNTLYEHLMNNHSLYLTSFVDFKLFKYLIFLNQKIDFAVNKFLIDKEYIEFINILKLYINSESINSKTKHLHLVYNNNNNSLIINDKMEIVTCNDNLSKIKYISDISFSTNDLALNTLLNLVPQKITIHLINSYVDEFINTLKLIFQERIIFCSNCDICNLYNYNNIIKQ